MRNRVFSYLLMAGVWTATLFVSTFNVAAAPTTYAVTSTDGVKLAVDDMSLDLVRGCSVDFVDTLGGAHFTVENPNAASGCGCGSSFSV